MSPPMSLYAIHTNMHSDGGNSDIGGHSRSDDSSNTPRLIDVKK